MRESDYAGTLYDYYYAERVRLWSCKKAKSLIMLKGWECDYAALQTRLDLYNSELALASSPVLFWNLCVQLEIWISILICGLAALVCQARKASPRPIQLLLSLLAWQLPAAQQLYLHFPNPLHPHPVFHTELWSNLSGNNMYSVSTIIRYTI